MLPPKLCMSHQNFDATADNICRSRLYDMQCTMYNVHIGGPVCDRHTYIVRVGEPEKVKQGCYYMKTISRGVQCTYRLILWAS